MVFSSINMVQKERCRTYLRNFSRQRKSFLSHRLAHSHGILRLWSSLPGTTLAAERTVKNFLTAFYADHLHFSPIIGRLKGEMAVKPITLIDRIWCYSTGGGFVISV